ncbi:MAG: BPL-N domain-containing protein [Pseudonocardia sediminis]
MDRRRFLTISALTVAAGLVTREVATAAEDGPLALIYRGESVTSEGSPETLEALLRESPLKFRTAFVGPGEDTDLSESALSGAAVYVQPGGGTVDEAWPVLQKHGPAVTKFVEAGGAYLGFCLGAYLAGGEPGFGLLDGAPVPYTGTEGATVDGSSQTTVTVNWRGAKRELYFQDGAAFRLPSTSKAEVLARYTNGLPAALVQNVGKGRIGLVGTHPEANEYWFSGGGFVDNRDLAQDLVSTTVKG